jgi:opacity protein-like surface antigen
VRSGFYLTAYVAGAAEMIRGTGGRGFEDWSIGAGGIAGYRATEWVSLELQGEWINGFEGSNGLQPGELTVPEVVDQYLATANAKLSLPFWGRFQPFAKYGLGATVAKGRGNVGDFSTDDVVSGFAMRFGGGIDVYATPNIAFTLAADYVLADQGLGLDYVPIYGGLTYRF